MENSEQMVSTEVIQAAYVRLLNRAFERQVPVGTVLLTSKTLKLRLPRPEDKAERQALDLWLSILTERSDVQFDIDLV